MYSQQNQPTGERPKEDGRRLDLERAYTVLIRVYLRKRQLQRITSPTSEVPHV